MLYDRNAGEGKFDLPCAVTPLRAASSSSAAGEKSHRRALLDGQTNSFAEMSCVRTRRNRGAVTSLTSGRGAPAFIGSNGSAACHPVYAFHFPAAGSNRVRGKLPL